MGFFKDDFYSTRVKRGSRSAPNSWPRASRGGFRGSFGRRPAVSPTFKVALISSLVSSCLVAGVFYLAVERPSDPIARPAIAVGQPIVDTSERIITAAEKVGPSVVSVINQTKEAKLKSGQSDGDAVEGTSLGSGVIFAKKDGKAYIITNAHVIADTAKLKVVLVSGDKLDAKLIGKDTITDLAVLEVSADKITAVADIGDSSKLRKGETVIAVGNPLGFNDSLSDGIVSNLNRLVPVSLNQDGIYDWEEEVIQISAPINPGNSGGALVNLNGEVVGINSMKVADTNVEGIGFSIPINDAMPIVNQIMEHGKVLRPYLGVYSMDLSVYLENNAASQDEDTSKDDSKGKSKSNGDYDDVPQDGPVIPSGVTEGAVVLEAVGPAKKAGLDLNDIIVKLDNQSIGSTLELRKYLYNKKHIGDSLTVTYYRDGKKQEVTIELVEKNEG